MEITAYFSNNNLAATGLSPVLTIVDVETDTIVLNTASMTEFVNASGWYKYSYSDFDPMKDYIFIADAGTDSVDVRYPTEAVGATNISGAVWNQKIEDNYTAEELMRVNAAALAGKVSGAGTGTLQFRDLADSKNRMTSTVDGEGNRTEIVLDVD